MDPRQADNSPAPVTPLDHAKEMQNEDMLELITKFWLLFDERDRKKLSKKDANAKRAGVRAPASHTPRAHLTRASRTALRPLAADTRTRCALSAGGASRGGEQGGAGAA